MGREFLTFLYDTYYSLGEVASRMIDFLNEQPLLAHGFDWTWGSVIFGTAVFAFLGYAVIVWLIP